MLINITYGEPSARVPFLQRLHFDVAFYMLTKAQELAAGAGVQGAPVGSNGGITVHGPVDAHTQVSGGSGSSCDWSKLVTQTVRLQARGMCEIGLNPADC